MLTLLCVQKCLVVVVVLWCCFQSYCCGCVVVLGVLLMEGGVVGVVGLLGFVDVVV